MDPKITKKTQDSLGKLIKKPPLTDKLLGKPPFRFLHDVMTSVIKTTGFMQGLFSDSEMNSENVKDKDAKIAFLQKAIDMVCAVTGRELGVKPVKVVAGHEPEKTNEFLQALADAINKNVDNDEYVKKVLKGGGGGRAGGSAKGDKREERKEREKDRSSDRKRERDSEEKDKREKEEGRHEKSRDKGDRDREGKHDRDKHDRDREKDRDRDRHKDRDRDSKSRDKSREERHRDKDRDRDRDRDRSKKNEHREKENESPSREKMNGEREEKHEPPSRLQRPSSAKGSRRRREAQNHAALEDEEFQKPTHEPMMGEGDLPPQVAAARQLARPSSARPAPPRPKQEAHESEPAMRLGTGQPTNLIVDDDDEDEDENFLVDESAPPPPEPDPTPLKPPDEEDAEHGALVKKMLESKKELEGGSQAGPAKKTEIERPVMSDAQRRKQRELVQKEIEKLRASIQSLTRSANPLGKVMDYVQEDMDSMQQELDKWRAENAQHALELKREMNVTDRAIDPLRQQLAELDRSINDQLDRIAALKANTIKNDQKIKKMLLGISSS